MPPEELVRLALLGAILGLDVVSFPQAMVSRPLVAATLAGWAAGDVQAGFLTGAVLELFALETLPVGASRYPEWGSAAVVGGALAALQSDVAPSGGIAAGLTPPGIVSAGALCLAVLAAGVTAWIGGETMVLNRKLNGRLARARIEQLAAGSADTVIGLQLFGLASDFTRAFLLTALSLAAVHPLMNMAARSWRSDPRVSRAVVVGLAAAVGAGAVWKLFHAVPRARWLFVAGLAIGLAIIGLV